MSSGAWVIDLKTMTQMLSCRSGRQPGSPGGQSYAPITAEFRLPPNHSDHNPANVPRTTRNPAATVRHHPLLDRRDVADKRPVKEAWRN